MFSNAVLGHNIQRGRETPIQGSIRGIRRFVVPSNGELRSPLTHTLWKDGENTALCYNPLNRKPKCSNPIQESCTCGFYGLFTIPSSTATISCLGIIEGFGKVILAHAGFRCSRARIVALVLPTPRIQNRRVFRELELYSEKAPSRFIKKRLIKKYPGAKVFTSVEAALEEFPLNYQPYISASLLLH
jgi:hypothetical protein